VTNLNSTHQIQALVVSVRLSFFLNAAACFAAAENIIATVNKGYNVIEAREAHRIAVLSCLEAPYSFGLPHAFRYGCTSGEGSDTFDSLVSF
jgi:hypothetical protein